ncbi:hypothetical protein [Klebsiella pneumoniae]|nr:hypothetical protein [Klebsiella pneumoniae]
MPKIKILQTLNSRIASTEKGAPKGCCSETDKKVQERQIKMIL